LPYRLLEADPALSYGDEETENMLIHLNCALVCWELHD
jgi:hypothetical protein